MILSNNPKIEKETMKINLEKAQKDIYKILTFHLSMVGCGEEFKDNVITDILNELEKRTWV